MTEASVPIAFEDFHANALPRWLRNGNGALAAKGTRDLGPLAFRLTGSGETWCYVPDAETVELARGDERASTLVELDLESWRGLVHDLESPPGLIYAERARALRGDLMEFVCWEPVLRAMYLGRPIYDPQTLELLGLDGGPLDLTRAFGLDDDPVEMAHSLRTAGYLHVRSVFGADEIETLRSESADLERAARPGDGISWWGTSDAGEEVLCRVLRAGSRPAMGALATDARLSRLAALSDHELVPGDPSEVDGVTVLWKRPGMVEGLGDLPWHRDCGMGGHAVKCPSLVCSIYLWPATQESGDLRFLPGSWRYGVPFIDADRSELPGSVSIGAQVGDVSLHYGDVVHGSPPPTGTEGPFRSSVLVGYRRPDARHHRGERHYNDVLLGDAKGQVPHMRKVAAKAPGS